eukprot:CAMPEP_0180082662 /NCGR_PEP_ID=MMETSP0985-20121206/18859_1 /TAXON_ID=483367 /ORGANISM="non described non described, Strain CCMP 2436" /LENGTH=184 /DNA_ID=CAMNT_0022016095 /DNA_START=16 /DNA_END=566 /DNA_ORIENTATION=+
MTAVLALALLAIQAGGMSLNATLRCYSHGAWRTSAHASESLEVFSAAKSSTVKFRCSPAWLARGGPPMEWRGEAVGCERLAHDLLRRDFGGTFAKAGGLVHLVMVGDSVTRQLFDMLRVITSLNPHLSPQVSSFALTFANLDAIPRHADGCRARLAPTVCPLLRRTELVRSAQRQGAGGGGGGG